VIYERNIGFDIPVYYMSGLCAVGADVWLGWGHKT